MKVEISNKVELELPEAWGGHASIIASSRPGVAPGWSVHLTSEPLRSAMEATQYALAQGDLLKTALTGYAVTREFEFAEGDRKIPVREYSWKSDDHAIHQCQAYFIVGNEAWTLTFSAGADDYMNLRTAIPDLLRGVRAAGGKALS